ncbi:hypothetical protein IF2G_02999 [Cordyceps javanica]|nr:hypothetical protein IF2G_02999 [Cordyceps javanica]
MSTYLGGPGTGGLGVGGWGELCTFYCFECFSSSFTLPRYNLGPPMMKGKVPFFSSFFLHPGRQQGWRLTRSTQGKKKERAIRFFFWAGNGHWVFLRARGLDDSFFRASLVL